MKWLAILACAYAGWMMLKMCAEDVNTLTDGIFFGCCAALFFMVTGTLLAV